MLKPTERMHVRTKLLQIGATCMGTRLVAVYRSMKDEETGLAFCMMLRWSDSDIGRVDVNHQATDELVRLWLGDERDHERESALEKDGNLKLDDAVTESKEYKRVYEQLKNAMLKKVKDLGYNVTDGEAEEKAVVPSVDINFPFGAGGYDINWHCPVCGKAVGFGEEIACKHVLFVVTEGMVVVQGEVGEQILEGKRLDLMKASYNPEADDFYEGDIIKYVKPTGTNYVMSVTTGGMACGPVWNTVDFLIETNEDVLVAPEKSE